MVFHQSWFSWSMNLGNLSNLVSVCYLRSINLSICYNSSWANTTNRSC